MAGARWSRGRGAIASTLGPSLGLVLLMGTLAVAHAQSTSPGPLASAHRKWDNRCKTCHEPGKGATDARCLECHKEAKTSRYHWKMAQKSKKKCSQCHRDHQGRGFRMVRWRAPKDFDHGLTGWKLQGTHTKQDCRRCHTKPGRYMGLGKACVNCHKNPHKPTLGPDCTKCHSQKRFAPAPNFSHDRARFRLRGRHREVQCAKCHTKAGAKGQFRGLSFKSCVSCHADPTPNHSRGKACESCHTEQTWAQPREGAGHRLHKLLPFKLTHKHGQIACASCHTARKRRAKTPAKRLRAFEGLRGSCAECHKDPHGKRFGARCADCHTPASWRVKPKRGAFNHNRTGFALRGRHRAVACARCHKPAKSYQQQYGAIPHGRCADCHTNPHAGTFASVKDGDRCEACHSVGGFLPANFGFSRHEKARAPLTGAHRAVACQACHTATTPAKSASQRGKKRRRKRRVEARGPRHVARLVGTPQTCASCHKSPHGSQFDAHKPSADCTTCHDNRSFRPASGFDHAKSRFALEGPHAKAACAACHLRPKAGQPVRFAGTSTRCADCHRDPHAGQFSDATAGPARTCSDCHEVVADFKIKRFDHGKTRFALRGRHAKAACARCHKPVRVGEAKVIHYRLGPLACARCHQNPHKRGGAR